MDEDNIHELCGEKFNFCRVESKLIVFANLIQSTLYALLTTYHLVALFVMFSVYASAGGEVTLRSVSTALSLVLLLRASALYFFILAVLRLSEGSVAVERIQVLVMLKLACFL